MTENPLTGSLTFRTGPVDDFASGPSEANVKLSSVGVWDQFLKQKNVLWSSHTLNYYNYDEQARLLVKRAVGYSAGFLDYFFRGTLEISLPADGVYGIVDHSTFDFTNSATGFRKIKVRVANTTPPIGTGSGSAQDMMGGRLVAVLKYRRNKNLYVADLSAECGSPGVGLENCRGDGEKILVSTGVTTADGTPVPSAVLPAGAGPQEFHFTFDEGLPLDVTDLYLQIVYRGLLGAENDAVVVATRDIPEPTYFTIINATDSLICVKGVWYALNSDGSVPDGTAKSDILQMGYVLPSPLTSPRVAMNFKPPFFVPAWDDPLALANALQPGKFIRVAILTDEGTPYVYDMEYFEPGEPGGFIVEKNTFTYSNGIPSQLAPAMMRNFRDTNHFQYGFAYRRYGANCTTSNWPTSSTAADGGSYPIPALVPINTLAF
jgi:hypothetical protein